MFLLRVSHPGITDGLVKGALSVAASAYKALCTGQGPTQVRALPAHQLSEPGAQTGQAIRTVLMLSEVNLANGTEDTRPSEQRLLCRA